MKCYRRLRPFKAISFDLDDTLYDNRPIIIKAEQQSFDYLRQQDHRLANLSAQHWFEYKQQVLIANPSLIEDVTAWRLAALEAIFGELKVANPQQMAQQVFQHFLHVRSDFTVPAASLDVLSQLAQVYPVIAITNGNVNLAQIGLADAFCLVLKAGDGLRAKPHVDMFAYAANHLKIEIADILHVGDHLTTDVLGAKTNGAQAIWFNDQGHQLRIHQDSRMLPDIEMTHLNQLLHLL